MNTQTNKKIDIVVKYFYPIAAGIETNIMETYTVLVEKGWDVTVHTSKDNHTQKNILKDYEEIRGIKIKRYKFGIFGYSPSIDWDNVGLIALHNFDIFPHFWVLTKSLYRKLLRKKGYALSLTPHGGFNPEWSMFSKIQVIIKYVYHYTLGVFLINTTVDGVRAVSEWEKINMLKKGVNPKLVKVIDNGIEDEAYKDLENLVSEETKAKVSKLGKYIVQVGRIYPIKNYETTIKALAKTKSNLNFAIVGPVSDEAYLLSLKNLIKELGLEERVFFMGVLRGIDKYYIIKHAEMMVHMAVWESYCNVVHEAMSQGLPCIVANNTALPLLIKEGVNGYCVETFDSSELARKIDFIIENMDMPVVQNMKKSNIQYCLGNSWREVAIKMDNFYTRIIKNKNEYSLQIFLRNLMYSTAGLINKIFPSHTPKITIYSYHSISDDGWRFSVTKEDFEQQMNYLLKDQEPITVRELRLYLKGEKKIAKDSFIITFDDGYEDVLEVKDFLKKKSIYPCLFVLSNLPKVNYRELAVSKRFLSAEQIKDLKESGWDIGSHGATHADFYRLTKEQIVEEVVDSKTNLENSLGFSIPYFAYPKGRYTDEILKALRTAGYVHAFSMNDGYVNASTNELLIPRVGVDGTHTMRQFTKLSLPFSMLFRKIIKKII